MDAGISSGVTLVGTLVAARLIGPAEVGLASIALSVLQIANFIAGALFADAIVQRHRLRAKELSAAFLLLAITSIALVAVLMITANLWARLYGERGVANLLRAGSVAVLLTGLSAIQAAMLRRRLRFDVLAISGMVSRTTASALCILAAIWGFGAWSLIVQYVAAVALDSLIVMTAAPLKWKTPTGVKAARPLLPFVLTETASQFVLSNQPRFFQMLIAYFLPLQMIGEINLAFRIVDSLRGVIASAAGRLCVAIFSRSQARPERLQMLFLQATKLITGVTFPAFAALAVSAPEIVSVVFGKTWSGAVPLLQVLSLLCILYFYRSAGGFMLTSTARPRISLALGSCALGMMLLMVLAFPPQSALWAMACWALPLTLTMLADVLIVSRVFRINLRSQLAAALPGLGISALLVPGLEGVRLAGNAHQLSSATVLALEVVTGSLLAVPALVASLRTHLRSAQA